MFLQLGEEGQVIELHCEYDRFFGLTERGFKVWCILIMVTVIYGAGTQNNCYRLSNMQSLH
jgi:hypothetical protein